MSNENTNNQAVDLTILLPTYNESSTIEKMLDAIKTSIPTNIGIEVIATGKITTWSRFKTTYQIDIDNLEIAGEGALLKLIEERKNRLSKKGFFDKKNKKNIPYLPSKLGI